jgi:hypothetical protein
MSRASHSAIEILPAEAVVSSVSLPAIARVEPSSIDLRQNDALRPAGTPIAPLGANQPDIVDLAPRSIVQVLFESEKFTAFKSSLMVNSNDWWTFTVMIGITIWSLFATTSRDTSTNHLGFALNTASTVARVVAFVLLWIVVGSAGGLQHIDPASTGRWATIRAFATAVVQGPLFPFALSLGSIMMSLNHGLKLMWFTTLESCLVAPTSLLPGSCTPSTFSLPSDRVSIIFITPIVAHVYLPSMRLSASLVSWLVGCTCIAASYVRIGVFIDTFNLLTAAFVPMILFKFDAAVWSSFTLHEQTVLDAERALSAVERTRALERTILETEKANVETRSAELRSMMGNVAHDLKTPIQSIAMGVELLRYSFFSHLESYACPSTSCFTFFFPCSTTTGRKFQAMCPLVRAPPNRSVRPSFSTAFGPRANS